MTAGADLSQLLDEIWRVHRETNLARIDVIERAALSLLEGDLAVAAREAAAGDAHKLTGVLGTLGWPQGSVLALEAESALRDGAPIDAKRLAEIAVALRAGSNARDVQGAHAPSIHLATPPGRAVPQRRPGTSGPRHRCVLLADPDQRRRHVTALQLGLGGYRVIEVGSMREIPQAAREGIDILVSEAQLEDGSAVAYATYLRRDARTGSLPILIATYDREANAAGVLGDDSVLHLPAAPSALRDRIGTLLAARPARTTS